MLPVRAAYRAWAATFDTETPVSLLDDLVVRAWTPIEPGPLLDVGCGTGRRLAGKTRAVGVDLSLDMLRQGRTVYGRQAVAAGDLRALPLPTATFAMVWCRLALGYLPALGPAYGELARVAAPGGIVIVTDFHPEAVAAGHTRSFRDAAGTRHEVEHHAHTIEDHTRTAAAAGLGVGDVRHLVIGPEVREVYARAGRAAWYARDRGLPLVLALRLTR
ncbi:MAG: class I SAM-dependent methyltransferase [Gemmatimonadales bacterium]